MRSHQCISLVARAKISSMDHIYITPVLQSLIYLPWTNNRFSTGSNTFSFGGPAGVPKTN